MYIYGLNRAIIRACHKGYVSRPSTHTAMSAVSGSWQGTPTHTTALEALKKEVIAEANQQIAGTNVGMLAEERAEFLMRLDAIKSTTVPLIHHDKSAYGEIISSLDDSIRALRSSESLQAPAAAASSTPPLPQASEATNSHSQIQKPPA